MLQGRFAFSVAAAAAFALSLLAPAASSQAQAQAYPSKPVTVIIPFAAGGGTDVIARILQEDIRKEFGQPVIIENRPGANGAVGSAVAARANPDGHTLMLTASSTFSLNPHLVKNLSYDQLNDFIPVGFVVRAPWMMVVNAKGPYKTVADVVTAAKASPGKLSVGHWTSNVLVTGDMFQRATGTQLLQVPYKGVVEAVTDLVGQRIDMLFVDIQAVRAYIGSGDLKYLAATTAKRVSTLPDIPTLTEAGYPSVVTDASVILFAPSKTPKPILEQLNASMIKVVSTAEAAREKLKALGHEPTTMSLPELDSYVRSELARWGEMIQKAGLEKQ